jgi:hypothetical protein
MILNFLLIMVVSALLFSLLIPPLKIEDAKAADNDGGLPRATENAPIPFLVGKDRLNAPNTIYCGNFVSSALVERVRSGLFSHKNVTVGHQYYLTVDLGFCTGGGDGVTLHEVFIDDVSVWTGTLSTESDFTINMPSLFGGYKNGGGFVTSHCRWFPGTLTQGKSSLIDAELGPDNLLPNYNGIAHLVFRANIGESPQLRKIAIVASRFTNNLGIPDGKHIIDTTTLNPAELLYTTMTDTWTGMAVDPSLIDADNFIDAGLTFYDEGNGCGGSLYTAKAGKAFAQDVATQVDAIITIDPSTNQLIIKPLRFDYDPGALQTFNESAILSIESFSQTLWTDLVSEVKVTFKDEDNLYNDATAVDQDLAVAGITGRLKTTTLSMPMVRKTTLATEIAGRELNQLSKPATSAVLMFNRKGYKLQPGSVFRWSWNDYNGLSMIMRVKKAQAGSDEDGSIRVEVAKDPYGEIYTTFASPGTSPTDPLTLTPDPVDTFFAYDAHRLLVDSFTLITGNSDPDLSFIMLLPIRSDSVSIAVSATINSEAELAYNTLSFPVWGLLKTDIGVMLGFADGTIGSITVEIDAIPDAWVDGDADTVREGGNLIYINGEVMGFETFTDNLDGTVDLENVHRGLLNTKQQIHTMDVNAVFPLVDFSYISTSGSYADESPVPVKFLPSSGAVTLSPSEVTSDNVTILGGYNKPDAPDYLELDASRSVAGYTAGTTGVVATWRARDRLSTSIRLIDEAADATPSGMTWNFYIFNLTDGGGAIYTVTGLTSPTHTFDVPDGSSIYDDTLEIRVYAVKSGMTSLVYDFYRFIAYAPILLLSGDEEPFELLLSGDAAPGGLII